MSIGGGRRLAAGFEFTHWPVDSRVITQPFGANPANYAAFGLPGHDGVDFRAPLGANVYAVAPGLVTWRGFDADGYGNYIIVEHVDGWSTWYAHLSAFVAIVGARVEGGQLIGRAGNTGNSRGAHLHLTLRHKERTYVDKNGVAWPRRNWDPTPYLLATGS